MSNVNSRADFFQNKIDEYETLLLSYADEKSFLLAEIARIKSDMA